MTNSRRFAHPKGERQFPPVCSRRELWGNSTGIPLEGFMFQPRDAYPTERMLQAIKGAPGRMTLVINGMRKNTSTVVQSLLSPWHWFPPSSSISYLHPFSIIKEGRRDHSVWTRLLTASACLDKSQVSSGEWLTLVQSQPHDNESYLWGIILLYYGTYFTSIFFIIDLLLILAAFCQKGETFLSGQKKKNKK